MMVGSVRGKERLERVVLVLQGGRSIVVEVFRPASFDDAARALSVGGQARLVPALTDNVVWPHVPQKVFRVFQSMSALAWAYMAAFYQMYRILNSIENFLEKESKSGRRLVEGTWGVDKDNILSGQRLTLISS